MSSVLYIKREVKANNVEYIRHSDMMEIAPLLGERIRHYRQSLGETQDQLAERLGISRATLINWEHGKLPAGIGKLIEEMHEAERTSGRVYQLQLPFDDPIDLEVRISQKRATSIRLDVERKVG